MWSSSRTRVFEDSPLHSPSGSQVSRSASSLSLCGVNSPEMKVSSPTAAPVSMEPSSTTTNGVSGSGESNVRFMDFLQPLDDHSQQRNSSPNENRPFRPSLAPPKLFSALEENDEEMETPKGKDHANEILSMDPLTQDEIASVTLTSAQREVLREALVKEMKSLGAVRAPHPARSSEVR